MTSRWDCVFEPGDEPSRITLFMGRHVTWDDLIQAQGVAKRYDIVGSIGGSQNAPYAYLAVEMAIVAFIQSLSDTPA